MFFKFVASASSSESTRSRLVNHYVRSGGVEAVAALDIISKLLLCEASSGHNTTLLLVAEWVQTATTITRGLFEYYKEATNS